MKNNNNFVLFLGVIVAFVSTHNISGMELSPLQRNFEDAINEGDATTVEALIGSSAKTRDRLKKNPVYADEKKQFAELAEQECKAMAQEWAQKARRYSKIAQNIDHVSNAYNSNQRKKGSAKSRTKPKRGLLKHNKVQPYSGPVRIASKPSTPSQNPKQEVMCGDCIIL